MPDYVEHIKELEAELKKTPYNKRTQHHIGLIKAKIARLRDQQEKRSSSKGGGRRGFSVRKTGDATAVLVGFPSVGKSTLLNAISNAESKTGSYAFTTLDCIPGLMEHRHAKIQLLDVPGLVVGAAKGSGRGKEVLAVIRNADLVIFIIDVSDVSQYDALKKELYDAGFRLDQEKPDVRITKGMKGGIQIATTVKLKRLNDETIRAVLKEFKLTNAYVLIREQITVEQLIDVIEDNKVYLKSMVLLNKADLATPETIVAATKRVKDAIVISATSGKLESLKGPIYEKFELMSVYLKEYGKKADDKPLIVRKASTVKDICNILHRDFLGRFRFSKVWGKSAKFPGQRFQENHILKDGDTVQLFLR